MVLETVTSETTPDRTRRFTHQAMCSTRLQTGTKNIIIIVANKYPMNPKGGRAVVNLKGFNKIELGVEERSLDIPFLFAFLLCCVLGVC